MNRRWEGIRESGEEALLLSLDEAAPESPGLTLAVLDSPYVHPVTGEEGLVTPMLRATLPSWQQAGLLHRLMTF